jgi:hypothetical protein
MAHTYSYTFDTMSRIGNDQCCVDQNTLQDVAACNYMTQNYFSSDCSMKNPIALATTQPGIMYNGGYNVGAGGCNINDNSNLTIGTIQTHPKCRIDLFHRPFATVPYLGRGAVNPIMESQIQQGEAITNKRSVTRLTEKSYLNYHTTPLIPEVKENIQNPSLMIEGVASEGWIRGGLPSRELTRDRDFYTTHTAGQAMP